MLDYRTAGESHGKCLLAIIEGLPYGTPIDLDHVNRELKRRQGGYGRGARMKMESDEAQVLTGLRRGATLGSPLTLQIQNRVQNIEELPDITRPRPGHADLAGVAKLGTDDARDVSERASARETTARTAAGAVASAFLRSFRIDVVGFVREIGGIGSKVEPSSAEEIRAARDASPFYMIDPSVEGRVREAVDQARAAGDTLGGVWEVIAFGLPPGIGSYLRWSDKLGSRLAAAAMSIQTVKGCEIGAGFSGSREPGSKSHDEIVKRPDGSLARGSNRAGGIEGGMTNGQPVVLRAACKPISTLRTPLRSVDLRSGEPASAAYERSDVVVVPAASVVGENVIAFEIARAFLEKFGADTYAETRRRFDAYVDELKRRGLF